LALDEPVFPLRLPDSLRCLTFNAHFSADEDSLCLPVLSPIALPVLPAGLRVLRATRAVLDGPLSQLVLPSSRCVVEVIPPKEAEEEEEEKSALCARFRRIQRCPACRRHSARCRNAPTAGKSFCLLCRRDA
jgi:hypothetical protein